jgi:hypothetical protein
MYLGIKTGERLGSGLKPVSITELVGTTKSRALTLRAFPKKRSLWKRGLSRGLTLRAFPTTQQGKRRPRIARPLLDS